jgi:hypothetical protein
MILKGYIDNLCLKVFMHSIALLGHHKLLLYVRIYTKMMDDHI